MYVDRLSPKQVRDLDVPVCSPLLYEVDSDCRSLSDVDPTTNVSGRFLNEQQARTSIMHVRDQGLRPASNHYDSCLT